MVHRRTRLAIVVGGAAAVLLLALGAAGYAAGRSVSGDAAAEVVTEYRDLLDFELDEGAEEILARDLPADRAEAQDAYERPVAGALSAEVVEWNRAFDVTVFDLEGDGDLDFLLMLHNVDDDPVWIQEDGTFTRSELALPRLYDEPGFLVRDRHSCDAADVDADGDVDLFCVTGLHPDGADKRNELWIQGPTGTFTEAGPMGAEDPEGRGGFARFFDLDGDEFPDLYVANLEDDGRWAPNAVFRNDGDATFTPVGGPAAEVSGGRCRPRSGDWNGDGLDDLVVCPTEEGAPTLFENRDGSLEPAASLLGDDPPSGVWTDAHLSDLNGDGHLDLIVATKTAVEIRINDPDAAARFGTADVRREMDDIPRALAVTDVNGDGLDDVYVAQQGRLCLGARGLNGPDVILLSPDWEESPAPYLSLGCSLKAESLGSGRVLVVNAFNNAPGAITVVRSDG